MDYWDKNRSSKYSAPVSVLVFPHSEKASKPVDISMPEGQPSESDIVERACAGHYRSRYHLLWDLVLNLYWSNRYALHLYEKRALRWGDINKDDDEIFLPVYQPWNSQEVSAIVRDHYKWLMAAWDGEIEDILFDHLMNLFSHKPTSGEELSPIKPTIRQALADPGNLVLTLGNDGRQYRLFTNEDLEEVSCSVPQLEVLMRHAMLLANLYPWQTAKSTLSPVGRLQDDDWVVTCHAKTPEALRQIKHYRHQQQQFKHQSPPGSAP